MKWLRLYHEARQDAKLECLTDAQFRVWFRLLCFASEQPERGTIGAMHERLLAHEVAGGNVELLNETLDQLAAFHCVSRDVSSGSISFPNFKKRQYIDVSGNAKTSTERVRKHRETKRLRRSETVKREETPAKRSKTKRNSVSSRTDIQSFRETEKENAAAAPACAREEAAASPETISPGEAAPPSVESGSPDPSRPAVDPHLREAIVIVRRLAGEDAARQIWAVRARLAADLGGRWDCYAAAMRQVEREAAEPDAQPIGNLYALSKSIALRYVETGIPIAVAPRPGSVPGATSYRRPREREVAMPPYHQVSPERRAELEESLRRKEAAAAVRREAGGSGRTERGRKVIRPLSRESLALIGRDGTVTETRTGT